MGMIARILVGWAATIPLAMLVSVLVYTALMPAYPHNAC
jgi:phosphate/sulfate permease